MGVQNHVHLLCVLLNQLPLAKLLGPWGPAGQAAAAGRSEVPSEEGEPAAHCCAAYDPHASVLGNV